MNNPMKRVNMKKRFVILPIIILGIFGSANAQTLLTYDDAIRIALQNNPEIKIARNNVTMSKNSANIGNAGLLPSVSLSGTNYYVNVDSSFGGTGDLAQNSAEISISMTAFNGLSNLTGYKKLKSQYHQMEYSSRNQIEQVIYSVAQAYYSAASAFENLQIAREQASISKERLERVKRKAGFGQAQTLDILSAEVDLNSDSVSVTEARLTWESARRNLNSLLDREINIEFSIDPGVEFQKDLNISDLMNSAVTNNAEYQASREDLNQAQMDLTISKSSLYPKLSLSSSYGYNRTQADAGLNLKNPNKELTFSGVLSFNLFNGFQTKTKIQNKKISIKNEQLNQDLVRRNLEINVNNSFESYRNSRLVLELREKNLESAQLNFNYTRDQYQMGQVTTTQFREAQLNLLQAKSNISSAKYSAKLAELNLLRLSGQLLTTLSE